MISRFFTTVFLVLLGSVLTLVTVKLAPGMRPATSRLATTATLTDQNGGLPLGSIVYSEDMKNVVLLVFDRHKLEAFMGEKETFELALATSSERISQFVSFQPKATDETLIILEVYMPQTIAFRKGELKSAMLSLRRP